MTNEQVDVKLLENRNNHYKDNEIETISLDNTNDMENNNSEVNYVEK